MADCTIKVKECKICNKDAHHFLLCPIKKAKTNSSVAWKNLASSMLAKKPPVLLQAQFVNIKQSIKVGAFFDLSFTDNYVTHRFAKKYRLQSRAIQLEVERIVGQKSSVSSNIYTVPIYFKGHIKELKC